MKITMQRDQLTFLVQVSPQQSRILDLQRKILYPPQATERILRQGAWQDFVGPQSILQDYLKVCQNQTSW